VTFKRDTYIIVSLSEFHEPDHAFKSTLFNNKTGLLRSRHDHTKQLRQLWLAGPQGPPSTEPPAPTQPGGTPGTPAPAAPLSFEPIYHDVIDLPAGVMPWAPTWSPDGKHILFTDYNDNRGNEWSVEVKSGSEYGKPVCLTCKMTDRPTLVGVFSYVFPDNKRMFIANELGDLAYVLECAPSLFDCATHKYLPIDLTADAALTSPNLGRRTFHLAPDGVHLAYSMVRLDALVMLVSRLEKTATGYAAVGHKVINPQGPTGPTDMSADNWANAGQLYEFKSFADGGASALIVGEPTDGNADMLKVDLAPGPFTAGQITAGLIHRFAKPTAPGIFK